MKCARLVAVVDYTCIIYCFKHNICQALAKRTRSQRARASTGSGRRASTTSQGGTKRKHGGARKTKSKTSAALTLKTTAPQRRSQSQDHALAPRYRLTDYIEMFHLDSTSIVADVKEQLAKEMVIIRLRRIRQNVSITTMVLD